MPEKVKSVKDDIEKVKTYAKIPSEILKNGKVSTGAGVGLLIDIAKDVYKVDRAYRAKDSDTEKIIEKSGMFKKKDLEFILEKAPGVQQRIDDARREGGLKSEKSGRIINDDYQTVAKEKATIRSDYNRYLCERDRPNEQQ